jgi:hypothetical protein
MQDPCRHLNILKFILYESPLDEGTLARVNKVWQPRCEPIRKQLCNSLPNNVNQRDRSELFEACCITGLGQYHH